MKIFGLISLLWLNIYIHDRVNAIYYLLLYVLHIHTCISY